MCGRTRASFSPCGNGRFGIVTLFMESCIRPTGMPTCTIVCDWLEACSGKFCMTNVPVAQLLGIKNDCLDCMVVGVQTLYM